MFCTFYLSVALSSRSAIDDKRRRLRAFLTCMRSDTPLMLNPAYVPQHLLVMASVLRYVTFQSTTWYHWILQIQEHKPYPSHSVSVVSRCWNVILEIVH